MRWIQRICKKVEHKHYLVFTFLVNGKLHPLTIVPHGGQSGVGFPKGVQLENNIIDTELVHPERVAERWNKIINWNLSPTLLHLKGLDMRSLFREGPLVHISYWLIRSRKSAKDISTFLEPVLLLANPALINWNRKSRSPLSKMLSFQGCTTWPICHLYHHFIYILLHIFCTANLT